MPSELKLQAIFTIEDDALVLRYTVTSRAERDAYLLNRLYRSTPALRIDPDIIFVDLDSGRRVVWLSKCIPDIPTGRTVTSPYTPFVTPLRAGGRFEELVRVALPVRSFHAYSGAKRPEPEERVVRYRGVGFTLGYYWRQEGGAEEVREVGRVEVVLPRTTGGYRPPIMGTLETELVSLDLPVAEKVGPAPST